MPTSGTTVGSTHWRRSRCRPACRSSAAGRIPLRIDGRLSSISGGLWHADNPSIVWFWPIVVLFVCALAAWRVRRPELDRLVARVLAITALIVVAIAGLGLQLHGRPTVTPFQLVELAAILAFVGWGLSQALFRAPGYFTCFLIAVAALVGRRGDGDDAVVRLRPAPASRVLCAIGDRALSRHRCGVATARVSLGRPRL